MTSRAPFALSALLTAVVVATGGCSLGCSDVDYGSRIVVDLPEELVDPAVEVAIELCQSGACASARLPASSARLEVLLSEFGDAIDADEPSGTVAVAATRDGTVLAQADVPLEFSDWEPEAGCGTYDQQVVELT